MAKKYKAEIAILAMLFLSTSASGLELEPALREADRLYQSGRYKEAAEKAFEIHRFFPDDLQTILVLGMSDFNTGNYLKASDWFKLADRKAPKHPLVIRYVGLLREIEHRSGPLSADPDRKPLSDNYQSAVYFKRNFFGPGFTVTSGIDHEIEAARAATPTVALPMPHPPVESILSETAVAEMAENAMAEKLYYKSYLFFSQLLAAQPSNRAYLLGKANSAFHMKRYRDVVETLGPIMAAPKSLGFSDMEKNEADKLLNQSRKEVFK